MSNIAISPYCSLCLYICYIDLFYRKKTRSHRVPSNVSSKELMNKIRAVLYEGHGKALSLKYDTVYDQYLIKEGLD